MRADCNPTVAYIFLKTCHNVYRNYVRLFMVVCVKTYGPARQSMLMYERIEDTHQRRGEIVEETQGFTGKKKRPTKCTDRPKNAKLNPS